MGEWDGWIGRERHQADMLDEALAARWLATFDLPPSKAVAMPQGIHLALCTPETATQALGEDGHPRRDDSDDSFLPPIPMPRRMWASSAMEFHAPIPVGATISRTSRVADVTEKSGGSGNLVFVKVEHDTALHGGGAGAALAVRETQTLVYRDAASADAPLSPPALADRTFDPRAWKAHRCLTPDPRLLFRYSALTFNTHRIHYDAPYAEQQERYRGLVVHGPLLASLLLQFAASELGENTLKHFSFRGVSPAVADESLHLVMRPKEGAGDDGFELGAFAADGRQVTTATATRV